MVCALTRGGVARWGAAALLAEMCVPPATGAIAATGVQQNNKAIGSAARKSPQSS